MVGVVAKTLKSAKTQKFFLLVALFFLYATPAEGIRSLGKEEVVKEKKEKSFAEETLDESTIEDIDESVIESEILDSIREFEKEKEEIIKEQSIEKEIEPPVFKPYAAPLYAPQPVPIVEQKKTPQTSKPHPKKKNILFDVIFFSIILALFFGIKTLLKPSKSK